MHSLDILRRIIQLSLCTLIEDSYQETRRIAKKAFYKLLLSTNDIIVIESILKEVLNSEHYSRIADLM